MKKGVILLLWFAGIVANLHAQTYVTSIHGQIADSITRQPLPDAVIQLLQSADLKPVAQTIAAADGRFLLRGFPPGNYHLGIRMIGYSPLLLKNIRPDSLHTGTIYLSPTYRQLNGITVTATRPLIEIKDDKIIYNVESDIDKDHASASEILRKVPMVTVDFNGQIKLRGSTGFKVLLNGRSTSIIAHNPAEALRAFPASIIKSIEVITTPSARYEGEGSAGIINIITRKQFRGYSGNIYANYKTIGASSGGAAISARLKRFNLSAMAGANLNRNRNTADQYRENNTPGKISTFRQNSSSTSRNNNGFFSVETSYEADSSSSISAGASFNTGKGNNHTLQENTLHDSLALLLQTGRNNSLSNNSNNGYNLYLDWQKSLNPSGHNLSAQIGFSHYTTRARTLNEQYFSPGTNEDYQNINNDYNQETSIRIDHTLPLTKGRRLETGFKATFTENANQAYQLNREDLGGKYTENTRRTSIMGFRQDIWALYSTYSFRIDSNLQIQPGVRLEQTIMKGDYISSRTFARKHYLTLIPTLYINWTPRPLSSLSFSYSRRIQRPASSMLNPFINDNDPNAISGGNPDLVPEVANSFSLNYFTVKNKTSIGISAQYNFSNNAIQSVSRLNSNRNAIVSSYDNIGINRSTGIYISTRTALLTKWSVSLNAGANYNAIRTGGDQSLHNDGFNGTVTFTSDYSFGKGFAVEGSYMFSSASPSLQGTSAGFTSYGITLRKELFKSASLTIGAEQFLQKEQRMLSETRDAFFYDRSMAIMPLRAFHVSFSWRFTQLDGK